MNAVFSFSSIFFNSTKLGRYFAGFRSKKMFLNSCVLSIMQAKKFFNKVIVITDKFGAEIFKSLELPIDILYDDLDERMIPKHKYFWAVSKIIAATYQKEPYLHLDLDLYMWKPLPKVFNINKTDLICLYREVEISKDLYKRDIDNYITYGTKGILKDLDNFINLYGIRSDMSLNCAIVGGNNLKFLNEYANDVLKYLEICDDTNASHYHSCVFLEQYYLGVKAYQNKIKLASFSDIYKEKYGNGNEYLTHFIWIVKQKEEEEIALQGWINNFYPEYAKKVKKTQILLDKLLENK